MLKVRQRLGKYRIEGRLGEGGFAAVYRAYDTIEGIDVALKVPHAQHLSSETMDTFRKEARLVAGLDHPSILHLKNASFIDQLFVIAYPLGKETLDDRMRRRMSFATALGYVDQMLEAVAYAHQCRIIHCDIKPENFILFGDDRLRLTDFGISRLALATRTIHGSGDGTVGYLAPEQAMGRPSFRSDVFSLGLVIYRLFSGGLPAWPFDWPPAGYARLRASVHPDLILLLRRALEVDARKRPADAVQMAAAYHRMRTKVAAFATRRRNRRAGREPAKDWRSVRIGEFRRLYRGVHALRGACRKCSGPLAETMAWCPWCGVQATTWREDTRFPSRCRRCWRGMKKDWRFCPWCYGPSYETDGRSYSDQRYSARCSGKRCSRKLLMPWMRYCPWCNTKVRRKWSGSERDGKCRRCGWGVAKAFWGFCAWCGRRQEHG
jgi:serine/threonine-protein kinase